MMLCERERDLLGCIFFHDRMVWSKIDFAEELADKDRADCFRASVDTSALGREARELAADWGRRRPLSDEPALLRDPWLR